VLRATSHVGKLVAIALANGKRKDTSVHYKALRTFRVIKFCAKIKPT